MAINNLPLVGTVAWQPALPESDGLVTDADVLRVAALMVLLRHIQVMLIDNDQRVTYAAKEDLMVNDSEFSLMIRMAFDDSVTRDVDALLQALEIHIDEPSDEIAALWSDEINKLTNVIEKATVVKNGGWSYTDRTGLTLSFNVQRQCMETNDESGDALMALANIQ